jgi:hypothetical protein
LSFTTPATPSSGGGAVVTGLAPPQAASSSTSAQRPGMEGSGHGVCSVAQATVLSSLRLTSMAVPVTLARSPSMLLSMTHR